MQSEVCRACMKTNESALLKTQDFGIKQTKTRMKKRYISDKALEFMSSRHEAMSRVQLAVLLCK